MSPSIAVTGQMHRTEPLFKWFVTVSYRSIIVSVPILSLPQANKRCDPVVLDIPEVMHYIWIRIENLRSAALDNQPNRFRMQAYIDDYQSYCAEITSVNARKYSDGLSRLLMLSSNRLQYIHQWKVKEIFMNTPHQPIEGSFQSLLFQRGGKHVIVHTAQVTNSNLIWYQITEEIFSVSRFRDFTGISARIFTHFL